MVELKKSDRLYLNPTVNILPEVLGNGRDIDYDAAYEVVEAERSDDGIITVRVRET